MNQTEELGCVKSQCFCIHHASWPLSQVECVQWWNSRLPNKRTGGGRPNNAVSTFEWSWRENQFQSWFPSRIQGLPMSVEATRVTGPPRRRPTRPRLSLVGRTPLVWSSPLLCNYFSNRPLSGWVSGGLPGWGPACHAKIPQTTTLSISRFWGTEGPNFHMCD